MQHIGILVIFFILWISQAWGAGNETVNTLPANNANFMTSAQAFWKNELAGILGRYQSDGWVYSGGSHATGGTCTSSAFATEAFTNAGQRVTGDGASGAVAINYSTVGCNCSNPGSDIAWVAITGATGNSFGNFQRMLGTNYIVDCVSSTQPTLPSNAAWLQESVITNGAVTSIVPLQNYQSFPSSRITGATNVKECGAKVDGTTDDTAALQKCLTDHDSVLIPAGVLKITSTVSLRAKNALHGVGMLASEIRYTGSTVALQFQGTMATFVGRVQLHTLTIRSDSGTIGFQVTDAFDVELHQVKIIGQLADGQPVTGFSQACMLIGGTFPGGAAFTTHLHQVYLQSCDGDGLELGSTAYAANGVNAIDIVNSRIQGNTGWGVKGHDNLLVRALTVMSSDIEGNTLGGIKIDVPAGVAITGNYFEPSVGGTATHIAIGTNTVASGGVTITGNYIQGPTAGTAIEVGHTPGGLVTGIEISGNYFSGAMAPCINIVAVSNLHTDGNNYASCVPKVTIGNINAVYSVLDDGISLVNEVDGGTMNLRKAGAVTVGQEMGVLFGDSTYNRGALYCEVMNAGNNTGKCSMYLGDGSNNLDLSADWRLNEYRAIGNSDALNDSYALSFYSPSHRRAAIFGTNLNAGNNRGALDFYTGDGAANVVQAIRIDDSQRVLVGTTTAHNTLAGVEVNGGVQLYTAVSKPACGTSTRGLLWHVQGGAGVADTLEVCRKDNLDAYAWTALY